MRKTRNLIILAVVLVVLSIAAVATYVVVQNNRAPEELSATPHAISEPFDPAALAGSWTVSKDSVAGYRVNEVLGGQDVTVVGRTTQVTGTVTIADSKLQSADITVNVDSVTTDSSSRDSEFRKLLKTAQSPDATFVVDQPLTLPSAANGSAVVDVPGTLTVAGESQNATATITATSDGKVTKLVGNIPVVFADYKITAPNLGFVTVEDNGVIEFSVELTKEK